LVLLFICLFVINQTLRSPVHIINWIQRVSLNFDNYQNVVYERSEYSIHIFERKGTSPVIIVPDLASPGSTWEAVLKGISPERGVTFIELLGHGDSIINKDSILFGNLDDNVEVVVNDTKEPVTLVGHGLGGWLAIRYALKYPDKVQKLVLINSAGLPQPIQTHLYVPRTNEELKDKLEWVMGDRHQWWPRFIQDDLLEFITNPQHHAMLEEMLLEPKLAEDIELSMPVYLLWGTPDVMFDASYQERWKHLLPEASVMMLENCYHSPQLHCDEQLISVITE